jgi:amino-acid N-acetyltransferase
MDIISLQPTQISLPPLAVAQDVPICIRQANSDDVEPIVRLVNFYAAQELMLPKTPAAIYGNLFGCVVADADGELAGCASLKLTYNNPAEIISLAVRPEFQGRQVGSQLILSLLDKAAALKIPTVFALTLRPTLFERLGFQRVHKNTLPHKVWNECSVCPKQDRCDEIAVLRDAHCA